MSEVLKSIVNNTIDREFDNSMADYESILKRNPKLMKNREESLQHTIKLEEELKQLLPEDKHKLITAYSDAIITELSVDVKLAFKEGVILGVTGLSYLREVREEIRFI